MIQIDIKFTLIFLLFLSFYAHSQNWDKKDEMSIEISANEVLQDEYCNKNINRELCTDISLKLAQLYYSRGKRDKNKDDFQKAANICCMLIQVNIDVETTVKVNKILDSLKNTNINISCKKQTVTPKDSIYDQYKAFQPGIKITTRPEKQNAYLSWSAAYIMIGKEGSVNITPDTIFSLNNNKDIDTVIPDYSNSVFQKYIKGFSLFLEWNNIGKTILGLRFGFLDFLFSESITMYQCHLDVNFKIPIIKRYLWFPVGVGAKFGALWFDWEYAKEFKSMYRNIILEKTSSDKSLTRMEFGFCGYGGIRMRMGKSPWELFTEAGYCYHPVLTSWKLSYKTGKKDKNGNDEYETIEVPDKYVPYNGVQILGLQIKTGFLFRFR